MFSAPHDQVSVYRVALWMCFYMARPEGFEPPTPAFVAQYSIQMNYGRRLNLRVVPPSLLTPFTCLYKVDQDSVHHLGFIQLIRHHVYRSPPKAISRASNPQPFTNLVLRRNLVSVTSLADTLKTWRSQGVTIPFFMRDRHTCVHEHFETNFYS
jgi:hypothetical protein